MTRSDMIVTKIVDKRAAWNGFGWGTLLLLQMLTALLSLLLPTAPAGVAAFTVTPTSGTTITPTLRFALSNANNEYEDDGDDEEEFDNEMENEPGLSSGMPLLLPSSGIPSHTNDAAASSSSSVASNSNLNHPKKKSMKSNQKKKVITSPNHVTLRKLQLQFTCKKCESRNQHSISRSAYQKGVVIVSCQGSNCTAQHLIADHLGFTNLLVSSTTNGTETIANAAETESLSGVDPNADDASSLPAVVGNGLVIVDGGCGNIEDFLVQTVEQKDGGGNDSPVEGVVNEKVDPSSSNTSRVVESFASFDFNADEATTAAVQRVSRQVFELERLLYQPSHYQNQSSSSSSSS